MRRKEDVAQSSEAKIVSSSGEKGDKHECGPRSPTKQGHRLPKFCTPTLTDIRTLSTDSHVKTTLIIDDQVMIRLREEAARRQKRPPLHGLHRLLRKYPRFDRSTPDWRLRGFGGRHS